MSSIIAKIASGCETKNTESKTNNIQILPCDQKTKNSRLPVPASGVFLLLYTSNFSVSLKLLASDTFLL